MWPAVENPWRRLQIRRLRGRHVTRRRLAARRDAGLRMPKKPSRGPDQSRSQPSGLCRAAGAAFRLTDLAQETTLLPVPRFRYPPIAKLAWPGVGLGSGCVALLGPCGYLGRACGSSHSRCCLRLFEFRARSPPLQLKQGAPIPLARCRRLSILSGSLRDFVTEAILPRWLLQASTARTAESSSDPGRPQPGRLRQRTSICRRTVKRTCPMTSRRRSSRASPWGDGPSGVAQTSPAALTSAR